MNSPIPSTFVLLIFLTLGTGCGRYEEAPEFSLRSKMERIFNTWRIERATHGGNDVTPSFTQYTLLMNRDGDATRTADYALCGIAFQFTTAGSWDLMNNNENLDLDFENNDADETYTVLRLKEDEHWFREEGGDLDLQLQPT